MKHKHCELIKLWAEGAIIQYNDCGTWFDIASPTWDCFIEYRIKPAQKPDMVFMRKLEFLNGDDLIAWSIPNPNLKLVFDGETRELKSAEVIK